MDGNGFVDLTDFSLFKAVLNAEMPPIYFTLDGVTDPRAVGGELNSDPSVTLYTGAPISINATTTVRARALVGDSWSALSEATFTVQAAASNGSEFSADQLDPPPSKLERWDTRLDMAMSSIIYGRFDKVDATTLKQLGVKRGNTGNEDLNPNRQLPQATGPVGLLIEKNDEERRRATRTRYDEAVRFDEHATRLVALMEFLDEHDASLRWSKRH